MLLLSLALSGLAPTLAHANEPMSYLNAYGTKNYSVAALLWGLIGVSLFVMAVVGLLLLIGVIKRWRVPHSNDPRDVPPERPQRGLGWIYLGTALSILGLLGAAVGTFDVLAQVGYLPRNPALTIRVIGHQWWWEVRYESPDVSREFTTANEIHIPIGKPVEVKLSTADVIHSFWVPELSGKMDTIPSQNNETWIEADTPGTYRGQCTEYCGWQHAHMAFYVMAEPQAKFDAWWNNQLAPAPDPDAQTEAAAGKVDFIRHCGACHAVRGTQADGRVGPDLSHLMTRTSLAAGMLPNTVGDLSGWISDPQRIKPGNYMPTLDLSAAELSSIRAFLETLH